MAQNNVINFQSEDQDELYGIGCIHCGNRIFRFSKSYIIDCGEVLLCCPYCGQTTKVTGNGEISTG